MRITKINSQHRRDFTAVYECESCGHTKIDRGYDDHYFHHHVVPAMKCDKCGITAHDWGYYCYCENAINENRRRGMTVIEEKEKT